ncbi:hypothetical protein SCLCIDRAFT_23650 [Scleroderma citrinum Foug A]|uniref:Uncharacterized protein n=1 Tax=Scleroderma citrinum Foug A TaxID=1036808 RepID=A0A0C3E8J8_9AGAM|nr:hypothetical protein SCLCIDRAFT_23650 [Scleroderma citrinum Foug A]
MFGLLLIRHSFQSTGQKDLSSSVLSASSSDPEKNLAVVVWWAAFGTSLFFRPAFELAIRILLLLLLALSLGALYGFLNLTLGHALLRAAHCRGYDVPLLWTMQAGVLGGIAVISPSILLLLAAVPLTLRGKAAKLVLDWRHAVATFVLEMAMSVALSVAAAAVGVLIVLRMTREVDVLDIMRTSRAGALGSSIISVVVVSVVAFLLGPMGLMGVQQRSTRMAVGAAPESAALPSFQIVSDPTSQPCKTNSHSRCTAVEITYYSLAILCVLTVRFLCF